MVGGASAEINAVPDNDQVGGFDCVVNNYKILNVSCQKLFRVLFVLLWLKWRELEIALSQEALDTTQVARSQRAT